MDITAVMTALARMRIQSELVMPKLHDTHVYVNVPTDTARHKRGAARGAVHGDHEAGDAVQDDERDWRLLAVQGAASVTVGSDVSAEVCHVHSRVTNTGPKYSEQESPDNKHARPRVGFGHELPHSRLSSRVVVRGQILNSGAGLAALGQMYLPRRRRHHEYRSEPKAPMFEQSSEPRAGGQRSDGSLAQPPADNAQSAPPKRTRTGRLTATVAEVVAKRGGPPPMPRKLSGRGGDQLQWEMRQAG